MDHRLKNISCLLLFVLLYSLALAQKIRVHYTSQASPGHFSGYVFLYLSKDARSPKDQDVGISFFPCFRLAVKNIQPGQDILFDDAALAYPVPLSEIERGDYYVQAVWDKDLGGRSISNSPGNMYNQPVKLKLTSRKDQVFDIVCPEAIKPQAFTETNYIKELRVRSALLSAFYGRTTFIQAAVFLPKEYDLQPERKFPVLYWVSGYGGDYHRFSGRSSPGMPLDTTPVIRVFLDGNCALGHSVYANSENNGPWGDALTGELLPEMERNYRTNGARLLFGHSSGGWTVLWLQTHYPTLFAACWSSSPDPVDFRNFQQVNLYHDRNMFYERDSSLRMVATVAGRVPWASMKQAYGMENIISRGEQMHSFDAVFSQRSRNGSPARLCDPYSGVIDSVTVAHWKNYDISLYLRTQWDQLASSLHGKIRISVGEQDNFLLNHAVHLLDEEMKKLDAGFVFGYYPGDHFTVSSPEYQKNGNQFLEQKYDAFMKRPAASN